MNEKKSLTVLIVDDDPDSAQALAALVGQQGHQTKVAYDGRSALRQVRDKDFHLVLLDIGLPDMDGYELARRMTLIGQRRLSIVALTGHGNPEDICRSDSAGLDDHIVKPCGAQQLARVLEAAMAWANRPQSAVRRRINAV